MNEVEIIFEHWNSKKIARSRRLTSDLEKEIKRTLKDYSVDEIREFIDFYETILELEIDEKDKKYFWTYKWNLYEFLKRGIKKFDGQEPSNYLRNQKVADSQAIIFRRK